MKLSVSGFKSISKVDDFEFRPFTLLAGINSSGKSSLIQALLLLKQSFEFDGSKILNTSGEYVNVDSPLDLIHEKERNRRLRYEVRLNANEVCNVDAYLQYLPSSEKLNELKLGLEFSFNGKAHLENMQLDLAYGAEDNWRSFKILRRQKDDTYSVNASSVSMVNDNGVKDKNIITGYTLSFKHGFLPFFGERNDEFMSFSIVKDLSDTLQSFFASFNYISPQRVKPELGRSYDKMHFNNVGTMGENTRFLLNENKNDIIEGYDKSLIELVDYWIHERMGLAQEISVTRDVNKVYHVIVKNETGVKVDLCQTGFGLSQLLPIVTQGFLTPRGGTLIVEDPDVHMHPRVQAEIVNLFADLIKHGRKVLIETHSDHIVTRMRLLMAQNKTLKKEDVNVCFVTNEHGHSEYLSCALTEEGMFSEPLPKGFLDSQEQDFREIISTQLQVRKDGLAARN